jgi:mannose-1-phosphate guanylyltransferase/mannose-6-phosphate isomerase
LHPKVHRPWGWYESIDEGGRFKVKPSASLSLQKHHHLAEHRIVVKGTAEITNGDKVLLLTENQSAYILLGEIHRLANPVAIPLEIIEVQTATWVKKILCGLMTTTEEVNEKSIDYWHNRTRWSVPCRIFAWKRI